MKIFVSWSGSRSKAVAEVMSDWIKCVLQATDPWISTKHIERGSLWFSEINEKLRDVSVGIVCLTQENKNKPWILFEAGALAKGLSGSRVCTFLVDLTPADLTDPLAQFNHTHPDERSMWELIKTLNTCLGEKSLEERVLSKIFEVYWPRFLVDFEAALLANEPGEIVEPRSPDDLMTEILENTRMLGKRISEIEDRTRNRNVSFAPSKNGRESKNSLPGSGHGSASKYISAAAKLITDGAPDHVVMEQLIQTQLPMGVVYDMLKSMRFSLEVEKPVASGSNDSDE